MKKIFFLIHFYAIIAFSVEDTAHNKSLIKNRANIAKENGGVYGDKMYIYSDRVKTSRELYEQSKNRSSDINASSVSIDKNSKIRSAEILVEGGNINITGREGATNIGSVSVEEGSKKRIHTTVEAQSINIQN